MTNHSSVRSVCELLAGMCISHIIAKMYKMYKALTLKINLQLLLHTA